MVKQASTDIKKTTVVRNPSLGYNRLKAHPNGSFQYITDSGTVYNISSPWELPVETDDTLDPSTLTPALWERHIVPPSAIGAWSGYDTEIALWNGTAWEFRAPDETWTVYIKASSGLRAFDGTEWKGLTTDTDNITIEVNGLEQVSILGIDHIIDDNNLSIDPSVTPMINPHRELVTRAFVDAQTSSVDYATIDKIPAIAKCGTTNDEYEVYKEAWNNYSEPNQSGIGSNCDPVNGVVYRPVGSGQLFYCYTNPPNGAATNNIPILPAGTYRFYASIDLVPYGLAMRENPMFPAVHGDISATSRFEDGMWLHEIVVPYSDYRLNRLRCDFGNTPPGTWFYKLIIQGTYPGTGQDLTVMGVDKIINADGYSLDGFISYIDDVNPNRALGTLSYINKTKNNPDHITIEGHTDTNIICSDENDKDYILADAYGHGIPTQPTVHYNWVVTSPSQPTLTNGTLELNIPDNGSGYCQQWQGIILRISDSNPCPPNGETWNAYVHTNTDLEAIGGFFWLYTSSGELRSEEQIPLADGTFLIRSIVPVGDYKRITGCVTNIPDGTVPVGDQPWFRFVKDEDYPPNQVIKIKEISYIIDDDNESIDGSDTPMSDAHSELITRAKAEALIANSAMLVVSTTINYEANPQEFIKVTANTPTITLPDATAVTGQSITIKNDKEGSTTYIDADAQIDGFVKQTNISFERAWANTHYFNGGTAVGNDYIVGCHDNNTWVKIDIANGLQTTAAQTVGAYSVCSDGTMVYGVGTDGTNGSLVSFNPVTDVETNLRTEANAQFRKICFDSGNNCLWCGGVRSGNPRTLRRFALDGTPLATIQVSALTSGEFTDPVVVGTLVYVAFQNNVYKIDSATNSITGTYPLSVNAYNMTYNSNDGLLYIGTTGTSVLTFDTSTDTEGVSLTRSWNYVGVDEVNNLLYGSNIGGQIFEVLDINDSYNELISYDLPDIGRWIAHSANSFWSFDSNNINEFSRSSYWLRLIEDYQAVTFVSDGIGWDIKSNYIDEGITSVTPVPAIETFTIDATIIADEYIDLAETPSTEKHVQVNWQGSVLFQGASYDYSVAGNRITFHTGNGGIELITGMMIQVKYKH